MSLTRTQQSTLRMIAGGLTRVAPNNKTTLALKKAGLVTFNPPFGWVCTKAGLEKNQELIGMRKPT